MAPVSIRKVIGLPATSRITKGVMGVGPVGPEHSQSSVARPRRLGRLRSSCFNFLEGRDVTFLREGGSQSIFQ